MNEIYLTLVWLASGGLMSQLGSPPTPGGTGPAAGPAGAAPAAGADGASPFGSLWTFMPMMLGVMLIFMLLSGRPQKKEEARTKLMLSELKKNDRVVTAGGIVGSVVNAAADSPYVTIRIDETTNTKMQLVKSSIVRVIKDESASNAG